MEFLVTDKNLSKLCDILMKNMSIKRNESSYSKCYSIITYHMKLLITRYKNNSSNIKVPDLIVLLNKECLQLSANFIKTKISQKQKQSSAPKNHDGNINDSFEPISDPRFSQKREPYEDIQASLERERASRQYGDMQRRPDNIDFADPKGRMPQYQKAQQPQQPQHQQPQLSRELPQELPKNISPNEADVINDMLNSHQQFPSREPDTISSRMNSTDGFHKLRSEREQDVAYMPPKQQFNPMISPQQQQQQQQQYDNQMNSAFFLTLEDDEADTMINTLKSDIKQGNNILSQINPYVLNHLDSSQLDLLIRKLSSNVTKLYTDDIIDIKDELLIKSDEHTSPNLYANYNVDITSLKLKHVNTIELIDVNLPINDKITECNKLYIIIDGELHELLIEEFVSSDINSIINAINVKIKDFKIVASSAPNNEIYLKHNANKQFGLNNPSDSILKLLGFTQLNYTGKNVYRITNTNKPNNLIYISLEGIGSSIIDLSNQKQKLPIKFKCNLQSPKEIRIKFKTSDSGDDLYDFDSKPHTLKFIFYHSS